MSSSELLTSLITLERAKHPSKNAVSELLLLVKTPDDLIKLRHTLLVMYKKSPKNIEFIKECHEQIQKDELLKRFLEQDNQPLTDDDFIEDVWNIASDHQLESNDLVELLKLYPKQLRSSILNQGLGKRLELLMLDHAFRPSILECLPLDEQLLFWIEIANSNPWNTVREHPDAKLINLPADIIDVFSKLSVDEQKVALSKKDQNGNTILHFVCSRFNADEFELFLKQIKLTSDDLVGAWNAKNSEGITPVDTINFNPTLWLPLLKRLPKQQQLDLIQLKDAEGKTALHYLLQQENIVPGSLETILTVYPIEDRLAAVMETGLTHLTHESLIRLLKLIPPSGISMDDDYFTRMLSLTSKKLDDDVYHHLWRLLSALPTDTMRVYIEAHPEMWEAIHKVLVWKSQQKPMSDTSELTSKARDSIREQYLNVKPLGSEVVYTALQKLDRLENNMRKNILREHTLSTTITYLLENNGAAINAINLEYLGELVEKSNKREYIDALNTLMLPQSQKIIEALSSEQPELMRLLIKKIFKEDENRKETALVWILSVTRNINFLMTILPLLPYELPANKKEYMAEALMEQKPKDSYTIVQSKVLRNGKLDVDALKIVLSALSPKNCDIAVMKKIPKSDNTIWTLAKNNVEALKIILERVPQANRLDLLLPQAKARGDLAHHLMFFNQERQAAIVIAEPSKYPAWKILEAHLGRNGFVKYIQHIIPGISIETLNKKFPIVEHIKTEVEKKQEVMQSQWDSIKNLDTRPSEELDKLREIVLWRLNKIPNKPCLETQCLDAQVSLRRGLLYLDSSDIKLRDHLRATIVDSPHDERKLLKALEVLRAFEHGSREDSLNRFEKAIDINTGTGFAPMTTSRMIFNKLPIARGKLGSTKDYH